MKRHLPLIFAAALVAAGCASHAKSNPMAIATLAPTANQTANGTVHFMELNDGAVEVDVDLKNVPPGTHGFHIHDKGDCGDNGNAAGGHFNPTGAQHGAPTAPSHHAGDFGNATADANGNIKMKFATRAITVSPSSSSVVGHAVVLHGNPDDLTTQPSGNAGPRIACGVTTLMSAGEMHH
jgi:superoxide dismutase, Cu-Zn family